MTTGRVQVGVDTGGTFTDLVVLQDGALRVDKVSSTPPDFERGIVDAVRGRRHRRAARSATSRTAPR